MGFSLSGTLIAIIILAPNLLMFGLPPKNISTGTKDVGIVFTILERIGQVACITILVISKDNFQNLSINTWNLLMVFCIIMYYLLWIRYVLEGHDYLLLWKPLGFIPIPMAIFPVCAFGFAALLGKSIWLGIGVVILAIGHFVNSWNSYKYFK